METWGKEFLKKKARVFWKGRKTWICHEVVFECVCMHTATQPCHQHRKTTQYLAPVWSDRGTSEVLWHHVRHLHAWFHSLLQSSSASILCVWVYIYYIYIVYVCIYMLYVYTMHTYMHSVYITIHSYVVMVIAKQVSSHLSSHTVT